MTAISINLAILSVGMLAGFAGLVLLLRTRPARHGRLRCVRHGLPTEIRRHRHGTRHHTWAGTSSSRVVPPATQHALDELDDTAERRRYAAANRYEGTVEITRSDLDAIFGSQPSGLAGVTA